MDIEGSKDNIFTIYSKSNCRYCTLLKDLLRENNMPFYEINCDEYLIKDKNEFLSFIEKKIGKSYKTFPMVFKNNEFIGGYKETTQLLDTLIAFDFIN